MICNANAYEGFEPYVYIINCHQDDGVSFPLMERLAKKGLRFWHDEQIRSTQAEWKPTTSRKLNSSAAVLVLLSDNFTKTHICRRQFTDAIESKKPIVVVRLDKPMLTLGMKLQTEACSLLDCDFPPPDSLIDALLQQEQLQTCVGSPMHNIIPQDYGRQATDRKPVEPKKRPTLSDYTLIDLSKKNPPGDVLQNAADNQEKPQEHINTGTLPQNNIDNASDHDKLEQTAPSTNKIQKQEENITELDMTFLPKRIALPIILSLSTGLAQKGLNGETVVGRQAKLQTESIADIRFHDECKLFSRRHFKLICVDNTCTLICMHDNNLTLNGVLEVAPNEPTRIHGSCIVEVPGKSVLEQFSDKESSSARFVIAHDKDAQELWDAPFIATLESKETGEVRAFWKFPIQIGRNFPWTSGAMTTKTISADHATISLEESRFLYQDHSRNGTIINDDILCHQKQHELVSGDVLRINGNKEEQLRDENFIFRYVKIERSNNL